MKNHQEYRATVQKSYHELEHLLATHPSRDKWLPHLDELVAKVDVAFETKNLSAFEAAIEELGIYIKKIAQEGAAVSGETKETLSKKRL